MIIMCDTKVTDSLKKHLLADIFLNDVAGVKKGTVIYFLPKYWTQWKCFDVVNTNNILIVFDPGIINMQHCIHIH